MADKELVRASTLLYKDACRAFFLYLLLYLERYNYNYVVSSWVHGV